MTRSRFILALVFTFLSSVINHAYAQVANASISGLIRDATNASVIGVSITATREATGIQNVAKSNNSGVYQLTGLIPGLYTVRAVKQGFLTVERTHIHLAVAQAAIEDIILRVGPESQTVSVSSVQTSIDSTNPSVSTVVDSNFVQNMPLNGRSFQDLISLTPGVSTASPQTGDYAPGSRGDFAINGQRTESNYYIIDGLSANTTAGSGGATAATGGNLGASTALGTTQSLISVDALQEFRVESSTYSAEYGRTPGGQISFVTKSGTNHFHGSAYDYLRNNAFDANDWFNDYYGIMQPALRQNDFGGTFGGYLPLGLLRRPNDYFFFFSYEGLRLDQPTEASPQYVPSESLRGATQGNLQTILNAFPVPTGAEIQVACNNRSYQCPTGQPTGTLVPSGLAPNIVAYSLPSKIDSTSLRFDHTINAHIHTFVRAGYTPSSTASRALSTLRTTGSNLITYSGGVDSPLSNVLANELRIGYSRASATTAIVADDFGGAKPTNLSQALGVGTYPNAGSYFLLDFTGVTETTNIETGRSGTYNYQWNATDTINWSVGHHLFGAGIDYRRISSYYAPLDPTVEPVFESPTSVLMNAADLLIVERQVPTVPVYDQLSLFIQDEWRVAPTLNLSVGLRWEVDPPPTSNNENKPYPLLGNLSDPSTYSLGRRGGPLYNTTYRNLAPRLGFAWKVHGNPGFETIARGGVGIFYDTGTSMVSTVFDTVGTEAEAEYSKVPVPVLPSQVNLSLAVVPPYGEVYAVPSNFQLPYSIEWNAALEQALGKQQTVTFSYVASDGQRLAIENTVHAQPLNPNFTYVLFFKNGETSNYQSLQIRFQRQMSHGLQALASYTWSHSLDYGSNNASLAYTRGNSDFDLRNNLAAALTWRLPVSTSISAPLERVLEKWALDGRLMARTAFPVNPAGGSYYDPGTGSLVSSAVNLVPGTPLYVYSHLFPGGRDINQNAFTTAPSGAQGNAPRNFVRGFGANQVNLALRREFGLGENTVLQVRAEAFNVLNRPNFGYIDPNVTDTTFGRCTETLAQSLTSLSALYQQGGARSLQFALKLQF